ncbi:MAG: ABC transporter permease [Bauldia sp.]|nr:ABC transporter permease [Bauldia sp.]
MGTLYLAGQYLRFHFWRSLVLVLAIALILTVPVAIHLLLGASERQLTARAEATPLLIGARGSTLDLVMNSLYFTEDRPPPASIAASDAVWDSGLATAIPLYVRFQAQGAPIVGTTLDYFDFRGLTIAEGRGLTLLGDAVIGAEVARRFALEPGDSIVSSPENLFDLAGVYPLKMPVAGVLAPTGTPDDKAIFVDIKTTWVIQGIGHGHDEPLTAAAEGQEGAVLAETPENVVAGAALVTFNEITQENIDSFHFHGDPESYPVSAVLAAPPDVRSGVILRGRYLEPDQPLQIVVPEDVVNGLLADIFQVRRVLDVVVLTIAIAAILAVALAFFLALQLRRSEIETIFKLGCRRATIARLVTAEVVIILGISMIVAGLTTLMIGRGTEDAALWLLSTQG